MHGDFNLILTLTGGLVAAFIGGSITQWLRLSPIVGYLAAGILVGPYTPGFVANHALAEQLAEIGVILLMFGVGLQFHVDDLIAVRRVAIPGAVVQSVVATALGAAVAHAAGWDFAAGIVYGIALSVASTVVLIRVLSDHRQLHTPSGHIAVGWLVVEDLITVLVLVLMPALAGQSQTSPALAIVLALAKVAALTIFTIVVGGRTIPWLLTRVSRTQSRELFTLAVLVTALGIAVAAAEVFGVSMALGAFLAGLVVGRSEFSVRAAADALPMRDAFAVLFFVSVGMLLNPGAMLATPALFLATLAVILVGKPVAAFAIVRLLRYPMSTALTVAVALAQIGEFSFIVATLGNQLGILSVEATNTIVGASIVSIILNPLLYRALESWGGRATARTTAVAREPLEPQPATPLSADHRAVIVGYGPIGRAVTRLLRDNEIAPTVVEMNIDTMRELRAEGIDAVHGDATRPDVLAAARVGQAGSFIVSAAGVADAAESFRITRLQNPRVQILARATHLREVAALRAAGADFVVSGEGEVALAFTTSILQRLGATPDQIDRERDRVRSELADRG